jgi:hypothetical protein
MVVTTGAGVTAGTVNLEISQDGTNWGPTNTAVTVSTTAAGTVYVANITNTPAQFVRARISVGITGGTVTATVASA